MNMKSGDRWRGLEGWTRSPAGCRLISPPRWPPSSPGSIFSALEHLGCLANLAHGSFAASSPPAYANAKPPRGLPAPNSTLGLRLPHLLEGGGLEVRAGWEAPSPPLGCQRALLQQSWRLPWDRVALPCLLAKIPIAWRMFCRTGEGANTPKLSLGIGGGRQGPLLGASKDGSPSLSLPAQAAGPGEVACVSPCLEPVSSTFRFVLAKRMKS